MSDDGSEASVSEEEGDDEEEKATPRRSRPRSSIGLRVALQFPKKLARTANEKNSAEPLFSSSCSQDSTKAILRRKKSSREGKEREDSASEPEDDSRDEESSDALLKRTMNIKENKAMVRPHLGAARGSGQAHRLHPASSALAPLRKCARGLCILSLFLNPKQLFPGSSGLGTGRDSTVFSPLLCTSSSCRFQCVE